jgi:hypothetical protein
MATDTEELICVRCGLEGRVNRESYELFERMHWVCFHFEWECPPERVPTGVSQSGATFIDHARRVRGQRPAEALKSTTWSTWA